MPRPTKTIPLAMRTPAQARRWRYSHGEIMRRMPDRGGDAHHARRPFGAVLSLGAFIGMPPAALGVRPLRGRQERPSPGADWAGTGRARGVPDRLVTQGHSRSLTGPTRRR